MITTLDGVKLKRGDIGFFIGVTIQGEYVPGRGKVHSKSPDYSLPNEDRVYSTRQACQEACDIKNKNKND
jgi:hypothetical protein